MLPQRWFAIWRAARAPRALLAALSLAAGGCQSLAPDSKPVFAQGPNPSPQGDEYPELVGGRDAALRCIEEASRSAAEAGYAAATAVSARGEPVDYAGITSAAAAAFSASLKDSKPPSISPDSAASAAIAEAIAKGLTRAALAARRPSVAETTDPEAAKIAYASDAVTAALASGAAAAASKLGYPTGPEAIASSASKIVAIKAAGAAQAQQAAADAASRAQQAAADAASRAQQAAADAALTAELATAVAKEAAAAAPNHSQISSIVSVKVSARPDLAAPLVSAAVSAAPSAAEDIVRGAVRGASQQLGQIFTAAHSAAPQISVTVLEAVAKETITAMIQSGEIPAMAPNPAATAGSNQNYVTTAPTLSGPAGGWGGGPTISIYQAKSTKVRVLYATDRKPLPGMDFTKWRELLLKEGSEKDLYYGPDPEMDTTLHYGICTVSVPPKHVFAKLERPGMFEQESEAKHFMIQGILELDKTGMLKAVTRMAEPDGDHPDGKDAFIFIHGFNVTFNDAAMRAAQMAKDFKFLGAPILFSWSSKGEPTFSGYIHDVDKVAKGADGLYTLISDLKSGSKVRKLHLVAHSMGNRALVQVLKELTRANVGKIFGEIILAAADVPVEGVTPQDAENFRALADHISLYVSNDDQALGLSKKASSSRRLGQGGTGRFIADGIDTIDASGVNGDWFSLSHSYFANTQKVLDDIKALLVQGARPDDDLRSRALTKDGNYWKFK